MLRAMLCEECEGEFVPCSRKQKFCSKKCRQDNWVKNNARAPLAQGVDTGKIGAIGELLVAADLLKRGFEVFRSVSQSSSCDLVALKDGLVIRVEVRVASQRINGDGEISVFKRDRGRQDLFAGILGDGTVFYRRPILAGDVKVWEDVDIASLSP